MSGTKCASSYNDPEDIKRWDAQIRKKKWQTILSVYWIMLAAGASFAFVALCLSPPQPKVCEPIIYNVRIGSNASCTNSHQLEVLNKPSDAPKGNVVVLCNCKENK